MKFEALIKHRVSILTKNRREFEGILYSFDAHRNLILVDTLELTTNEPRGLGMIILRGENILTVTEVSGAKSGMEIPSYFKDSTQNK